MMNIAYLVPTYPMPSQTFIRREIAALEAQGFTVHRFAARRFAGELADAADRAEQERTCYILDAGAWGLARALIAEAVGRPRRWLAALATAVRLGRRSERGLIWHLIYLAEACLLRRRLAELRRPPSPRPLRHQRGQRRAAVPPARRPPLQHHDPRARGIRRTPATGPAREGPSCRLHRRHQPVHP